MAAIYVFPNNETAAMFVSQTLLWELNSFLKWTLSFVPINLHRRWPREWKHSILILTCKVKNVSTPKNITDRFQVNCDRDRRYNLRNSDFALPGYNTVANGEHSIRYLGPWAVGWKKREDDVFPFSVLFVEFPCQSPSAVSQPRINFKRRPKNAGETTSFPGLFLHNKATASVNRQIH